MTTTQNYRDYKDDLCRVDICDRQFPMDWWLFILTLVFVSLGIVMVYDASFVHAARYNSDSMFYLKRQAMFAGVGLVGMFIAKRMPYWWLSRIANWMLAFTMILLVAVHFVGHGAQGAERWIGYGPIKVQPSEFAKLSMVLYLARVITANPKLPKRLFGEGFFPLLIIPVMLVGLVEEEPDLGTAVTILLTAFLVLFASGVPKRWIALLLAFFTLAGFGMAIKDGTDSYRWKRITTFVNPDADPLRSGYQIRHSLVALGTGGLTGVGFGESREKQLGGLPAQRTDFIFAILGEELGLAGTCGVLALFTFFAIRGFHIASRCRDRFGALVAIGITGMITIQALVNIGVVTSSMPATGIPLPFLSYGGSSLVATLFGVGILLNISQHPFRREGRTRAREAAHNRAVERRQSEAERYQRRPESWN